MRTTELCMYARAQQLAWPHAVRGARCICMARFAPGSRQLCSNPTKFLLNNHNTTASAQARQRVSPATPRRARRNTKGTHTAPKNGTHACVCGERRAKRRRAERAAHSSTHLLSARVRRKVSFRTSISCSGALEVCVRSVGRARVHGVRTLLTLKNSNLGTKYSFYITKFTFLL